MIRSLERRSLKKWLKNRRKRQSQQNRRLQFESLEDRRLLAFTPEFLAPTADVNITQRAGGDAETTIAVNPTDPLNMIMGVNASGAFDTVWNTFDGGQNWTAQAIPNFAGTGAGGDPTVVFNNAGLAVYSHLTSAGGLTTAVSPDGGNTWTPGQVTADGNGDDKEFLAVGPDINNLAQDRFYLGWQRSGALFSSSSIDGINWTAPVRVDDGAANAGVNAQLAVGSGGEVYYAWQTFDNLSRIMIDKSIDGGLTWGTDQLVIQTDIAITGPGGYTVPAAPNRGVSLSLSMDVDRSGGPNHGNVYIGFMDQKIRDGNTANAAENDDTDIYMVRSTDGGNTFPLLVRVNDDVGNNSQFNPWLAVDQWSGNVGISWHDVRSDTGVGGPGDTNNTSNDDTQYFATASFDGGLSFSPNVQASDGTSNGVAAGGFNFGDYSGSAYFNNVFYMVWADNSNATGDNPNGALSNNDVYFDRAILMGPDEFEANNIQSTATILGSLPKITLRDLTLDKVDDVDFFKYTAQDTGKLIVNLHFDDEAGNLDLRVRDMNENIIASSLSITDNEQIIIPVVSQEMYFIEVFSPVGDLNIYDLEIENFAAPVPSAVHLDPASDTGMMNNDNLTADDTPTFFIQADLRDFANMGIDILDATTAAAGMTPGAAVLMQAVNSATGDVIEQYADPVGSGNFLFQVSPTLGDGVYFVSASVVIFDGQEDANGDPAPAMGQSQLSAPLWVTIDADGAPKGMVLENFTAASFDEEANDDTLGVFAGFSLNPANTELGILIELAGADLDGSLTPEFDDDKVERIEITDNANALVFDVLANGNIDAASGRITALFESPDLTAALITQLKNGELNLEVELMGGLEVSAANGNEADITPAVGNVMLELSSDTGMSQIDRVTNKMSPAILVKGEANAKVRIFARNELTGVVSQVGSGVIGSDGTDGVYGNGFGLAEITTEPLADGTYEIFAEFEDGAGNISSHYDFAYTGGPVDIPDGGSVEIEIDVQHLAGVITDIDLKIDGLFVEDLSEIAILLRHPTGFPNIFLVNPAINALSGTEMVGTIIDDEAALPIYDGTEPYTGRFQGEGDIGFFEGGFDPNGTWTLEIRDEFGGGEGFSSGTLEGFRLCIETDGGLPIEIDTEAPNTPLLDLVEESDSGRNNDDNITNDNTPTVTMTSTDPNSQFHELYTDNLKFRIYDRFEALDGQTALNQAEFLLYDSTLDPGAYGQVDNTDVFTLREIIVENLPEQYFALQGTNNAVLDHFGTGVLADGIHFLKLEVEDRAGNISEDYLLPVTIDTVKPNVFFGEPDLVNDGLHPDSDSGVAGPGNDGTLSDRITNDQTPTFHGTAEADAHVTAFVQDDSGALVEIGQNTAIPLDGEDAYISGEWQITSTVNMNNLGLLGFSDLDGLRQISVHAEDVAGNSSWGEAEWGIGPQFIPANTANTEYTITVPAGITNPITGLALKMSIDHPDFDQLVMELESPDGTVVTVDPTQAVQTFDDFDGESPAGDWILRIDSSATDNFGQLNFASLCIKSDPLDIFVDTQGPQVDDVFITGFDGDYDLFGLKPQKEQGATPAITSITIDVLDLPDRITDWLYDALQKGDNGNPAENPGNYLLVGDANGIIPIANITVTNITPTDGNPAEATIELEFDEPLPDDRYTLTVKDNVVDPAGNKLDGESNANEPNGGPDFPSGDGQPGGDFVARFTVDSHPEIGVYAGLTVSMDINGNFIWDPENADDTNEDFPFEFFGTNPNDQRFLGRFNIDGNNQGGTTGDRKFDVLGSYGFNSATGLFELRIDDNLNGAWEPGETLLILGGGTINGVAVAGDFDQADDDDEIALFDGTTWFFFDTDGTALATPAAGGATSVASAISGYPIVGDFDGDGLDDLGAYQQDRWQFDLADNGFGNLDASITHFFAIGTGERPVSADMNLDGIDDIGLWIPNTETQDNELAEWRFLISDDDGDGGGEGGGGFVGTLGALDHRFSPDPLGNDLAFFFGKPFALPLVGNVDPPVGTSVAPDVDVFVVNSLEDFSDANPGDGLALDASGNTTLRAAIEEANALAGIQTIGFDIAGSGTQTISLQSALPEITEAVVIDGTTEPDFAGTPVIELDGSNAGSTSGLVISSGGAGTTIRGLAVNRFQHHGIYIAGGGNNAIEGNFIGTDSTGSVAQGNARNGIVISSSDNNTIGGTAAGAGNVIAGQVSNGILIMRSSGNTLAGNFVGTNAASSTTIGNGKSGIIVSESTGTVIGGSEAGARNVISGNGRQGIWIVNGSTGVTVEGNHVGTSADATTALGNARNGVVLDSSDNNTIGGTTSSAGNVIAGNNQNGVLLMGTSGTTIAGNFIGTNAAGSTTLGNAKSGIIVSDATGTAIGGSAAGERNVISGNGRQGIWIVNGSTGVTVEGNHIGRSVDGTTALGNARNGVYIVGADNNTIGGTVPGAGNVISGNADDGIRVVSATGNAIHQNSIFSNAQLGIDLNNDGTTANDAGDPDAGANNLQNSPEITSASLDGAGNIDISYSVSSLAANSAYDLTVEFFLADGAGEEGQTFLGSASYSDATNLETDTITIPAGVAVNSGDLVVATATDADGNTSEFSVSTAIGSGDPLLAYGGEAAVASSQVLTSADVDPLLDDAIAAWQAAGISDSQLARLEGLQVGIADLSGARLGEQIGNTITIDVNAAGYGWHTNTQASVEDRMDLLTVIYHEMGHALGLSDDYSDPDSDDIMNGWLKTGTRREPSADDLDSLFGNEEMLESLLV